MLINEKNRYFRVAYFFASILVLSLAPATFAADDGLKIGLAQKAYYITSDCKPESNIGECAKQVTLEEAAQDPKKQESEFVDFLMYLDDKVGLPFRAFMPYNESVLELSWKGSKLRFEGIMVVCVDKTVEGKIRAKIFQAGRHKVIVAKDSKNPLVLIKSGNRSGLKHTSVDVSEGRVAVTVPWICESCEDQKVFFVDNGQCFEFKYRPEAVELQEGKDGKKPTIEFKPPKQADAAI